MPFRKKDRRKDMRREGEEEDVSMYWMNLRKEVDTGN
jgi:hypothetical protein